MTTDSDCSPTTSALIKEDAYLLKIGCLFRYNKRNDLHRVDKTRENGQLITLLNLCNGFVCTIDRAIALNAAREHQTATLALPHGAEHNINFSDFYFDQKDVNEIIDRKDKDPNLASEWDTDFLGTIPNHVKEEVELLSMDSLFYVDNSLH